MDLFQRQVQPNLLSSLSTSASVSTAAVSCLLPVSHFWYVNLVYKEEIKRIEKMYGVKLKAEVNVEFDKGQGNGNPEDALSKFTDLVQRCLGESDGSVVPLQSFDAEKLEGALKIINQPESKALIALSSQEMTVCGPSQSKDAIIMCLSPKQKAETDTASFPGSSSWSFQHKSQDIVMNIKDPLVDAGLILEEFYWKQMNLSYSQSIDKISNKFCVRFNVSPINDGKVKVKAVSTWPGGNALLENHAVRALLRLYQKTATSLPSSTQPQGAAGFSGPLKNSNGIYTLEGAFSRTGLNGQLGDSEFQTVHTEDGAKAGDDCPICLEKTDKKKQLKCKHEFCEECLAKAVSSMGPCCPVCKDIFGTMIGDQPDGHMSTEYFKQSLPGFKTVGTIVITYDIPDGKQTVINLNIWRDRR